MLYLIFAATLSLACYYSHAQYLKERYFGKFDEDTMIYHVVSIPFNAYELKLRVWIDKFSNEISLSPKLLVKYDGLPTLTSHDGTFIIPSYPQSLLISDYRPQMAQLYVGIWGGKLLHSNRYFAGSPASIAFGIEVTAMVCEGMFLDNECQPHMLLPLSMIAPPLFPIDSQSIMKFELGDAAVHSNAYRNQMAQTVSLSIAKPSIYTISVPSNIELLLISVSISRSQIEAICTSDDSPLAYNSTRRLFLQLYRDELDNEADNGSEYIDFQCSKSCSRSLIGISCSPIDLQFPVEFPMLGYWNMYAELSFQPTSTGFTPPKNPKPAGKSVEAATAQNELLVKSDQPKKKKRPYFASSIILASQSIGANNTKYRKPVVHEGETFLMSVEVTAYSCPSGMTGYADVVRYRKWKNKNKNELEEGILNCFNYVGELTRLQSTDSSASGYVVYTSSREAVINWDINSKFKHWNDTTIEAVKVSVDNKNLTVLSTPSRPHAMFSILAEPNSGNFPVGGYMEVALRVRNLARDQSPSLPFQEKHQLQAKNRHFVVGIRCGGVATDPFQRTWGIGNKLGDLHIDNGSDQEDFVAAAGRYSANGVMLLTSQAIVSAVRPSDKQTDDRELWWNPFQDKQSGWFNVVSNWFSSLNSNESSSEINMDDAHLYDEIQYNWLISKPTLPNLNTGRISIRVVPIELPRQGNPDDQNFHPFPAPEETSLISLSISFMPCSKSSCAHGVCTSQKGSVTASSCVCTYPWAGERCSDLSIPLIEYIGEVALLVVSNLAMIPSLVYCYRVECWILLVVLFASMMSSMLYHICDTDVYCAGVTFSTWQVVDNLFCILSIMSLIVYYAPVSLTWYSTVIFIFMTVIVSPVSSSPTSPLNGIGGALLAISVLILQWVKYLYWNTREGSNPHERLGSPIMSLKHMDISDEYSAVASDDDKERLMEVQVPDDMIEMASTRSTNLSSISRRRQEHVVHHDAEHAETTFSNRGRIHASIFGSLGSVNTILILCMQCKRARLIGGTVLVVVAILSFANQNKDNYWLLHSVWHVCMMLGGYLLLLSRNKFILKLQQKL